MIAHNGKPITIAMRNRKPINLIARNGKAMFGELEDLRLYGISHAAKAAIIAEYGDVVWQDTRDYAKAHPAIVPFINQDPHLAPYLEGDFRYYLDARDGLQDGLWVDRFNPAIGWQPQGNCKHTGDGFTLSNTGNATMYMNQGKLYDLGNHFKVVVEFTANADAFGMDFGSVTSTDKNISFQAANGFAEMNWKMQGNNSNPGVKNAYSPMTAGRHSLVWEIRDAGNGYDFLRFILDGVAYDGSAIIPQATNFGGYRDWADTNFYMGRGVAGNQYCPTDGTIHKMLIFVLD